MGLWTILKKIKQKEKEMRLLMLGLDNAGKTTIVKKFNGEDIESISPTLGFNIKTLEYNGFTLNFWDVGGQTSLRSYWRNYFEETDGLLTNKIWVVDSADVARLMDCKAELQKLLQEEKLAGASLLVLANKQDLQNSKTLEQIAQVRNSYKRYNTQILELESIKNRHCNIIKCSAITGEGLEQGIQWLVEDISSRIFMLD